jgi:tetrapyrrole methylase family protein/MazG family protein
MSWFSLVERTLDLLGSAVQDLQIAGAEGLAARHYPNLSPDRPALVGPLTDAALCRRLSLLLGNVYPREHEAVVVSGADRERPSVHRVTVGELERAPLDGISLLYLPPLPCPGSVETFQATVAHLRAPDGCPWDREQTHQSLRQGFLEEAYEVIEALDRGDLELLKEELGDVLLHILLQAQIASERDEFRMSDIVCHVNRKIVYRHPHVFEGLAVDGVDQVLSNWEDLKRQEKAERASASSPFEGIPLLMPALARAQAMLRRAARLELPPEVDGEVGRISDLVSSWIAEQEPADKGRLLGDLLLTLAGLGSGVGVDMESVLREANLRFERRLSGEN